MLRQNRQRPVCARQKSARRPPARNVTKSPNQVLTDALRRAITAARKQELDASIQSTQSQLASQQAECVADLSRLTLWQGELDEMARLALPNRESIHQFEELR